MSDDQPAPIKPPIKNRKADLGRAAAKGALGAVPVVGSGLAEAADQLLPDPTAQDRERWEGDVTHGVNHLHGRVDALDDRTGQRTTTLEGAAAKIAKFMVERCPDGLNMDYVDLDDILAVYPDLTREELRDGLGELESYGLIEQLRSIGRIGPYRLAREAYAMLDGPIMGWDTTEDAREVASLVLKGDRDGVRVSDLHADTGWDRRRFNPALRLVVDFVSPGRVSQTIQAEYVTRYFSPDDAERAILRRFAAGQ